MRTKKPAQQKHLAVISTLHFTLYGAYMRHVNVWGDDTLAGKPQRLLTTQLTTPHTLLWHM